MRTNLTVSVWTLCDVCVCRYAYPPDSFCMYSCVLCVCECVGMRAHLTVSVWTLCVVYVRVCVYACSPDSFCMDSVCCVCACVYVCVLT